MSVTVSMPQLGESVTEGTVTRWLKKEGERVEADEPLLEVSTDKVDTEIPSPVSGILRGIAVAEDETVAVGAQLAIIDDSPAVGAAPAEGDAGPQETGAWGQAAASPQASGYDHPAQPGQAGGPEYGPPPPPGPQAGYPAPPAAAPDYPAAYQPEQGYTEHDYPAEQGQPARGYGPPTTGYAPQPPADFGGWEEPYPPPEGAPPAPGGTGTESSAAEALAQPAEAPPAEAAAGPAAPAEAAPAEAAPAQEPAAQAAPAPAGGEGPPAEGAPAAPGPAAPAAADAGQAPAAQTGTAPAEAAPAGTAPAAAPAQGPAPTAPATPAWAPAPRAYGEQAPPPPPSPAPSTAPAIPPAEGPYVTPLVRKLAAEHGVNLADVSGTGVGGRIRKQDVLDAARILREQQQAARAPVPAASDGQAAATQPAVPPGTAAPAGPARVIVPSSLRGTTARLSRARQLIAQRMVESLQTSAQLTTVVEADITEIARLRETAKADFVAREGVKLSFLPFFALAAVEALKIHPKLNAVINTESGEVTYHDAEHLGMAVDTERGLMVPVIRNAGDLNIGGLARKIADLAQRTRAGQVSPDDLAGGTFTLTNTGSRGALFDTPIINQPQVAILGTGAVVKRPVVMEDPALGEVVAVRSMVYLALTYDHRLIDGADAARFLATVKDRLEEGAFESELGL
jgi:pyruvate dehydrogenase E2 component (dihydrolipoyllysine-residue acetyltransferase)